MTRRTARRRIRTDVIRKPPPQRSRPPPSANPGYYEAAQRPLQCLVFLLPMIVLYNVAATSVDRGDTTPTTLGMLEVWNSRFPG